MWNLCKVINQYYLNKNKQTKKPRIFPVPYKKNAWHIYNSQCSEGCVLILALSLIGCVTLVWLPDLANKTTVYPVKFEKKNKKQKQRLNQICIKSLFSWEVFW